MIHSIFTGIASLFLAIGSLFGGHAAYGAVTPVGSTQFTLAGAGVNSTQSTIPLASFTTPDGRPLVMSMFGTIGYGALEPQTTAKLEDITFTGITQNTNGSATLTGVSRGNDFVTPYAASTTLAHSHAGGATFILTNTAGFYTQFAGISNAETITGLWTFASTAPPTYDANITASGNQFVSANQLNSTAFQGAATATEATLGLTRLATNAQVGVGTASSTSGAPLVIPNKFATTTPGALCTSSWNCLVAATAGKISQSWLNLAQAFTFTNGLTSTATTTLAGSNVNSNALVINGVATQWPSAHGVAGTLLSDNGSGVLSWGGAPVSSYAIPAMSTTTNDGSGNSYVSDTVITTGFQPSTFEIAISGNANGAGGVGYVVATNYFEGTNCVSGFVLKPNSLSNTWVPGSVSNGCLTGPSNDTTLTAGIVNITSTGFTLEISHSGGSGGFPNATLKVSGMAFR